MRLDFRQRQAIHDLVGIPEAIKQLNKFGCTNVVKQGHEYDREELRQLLAHRRDMVSLMKRFKPDIIGIRNGDIFLCEVKSEQNDHPNFAIEFDSFIAAREHRKLGQVIYAFVSVDASDLKNVEATSSTVCDANDIDFPVWIQVPNRFDHLETVDYIQRNYPNSYAHVVEHKNGSGTAYFLISKKFAYLSDWTEFFNGKIEQLTLFDSIEAA